MSALSWILRRLSSPAAADAIEGDLREAGARRSHLWKIWQALGVVASLVGARARGGAPPSSGGNDRRGKPGGPPGGSRGSVLQDARFALRVLRSRPVATAAAVLSLALGIGANTAIFSLLDAILLRPLPVPDPEALVTSPTIFSYPDYVDLATATEEHLEGLAAWYAPSRPFALEGPDGARPVLTELVTGTFFDVLRPGRAAGRLLRPDDDVEGNAVAVISHRLWLEGFAAMPEIAGAAIRVNGVAATVIGVAAPRFRGARLNRSVDVWMPLSMQPLLTRGSQARLDRDNRGTQWLRIVGRLRAGVATAQAEAAMLATAASLHEQQPSPYLEDFEELQPAATAAVSRNDEVRRFLGLMSAMVAVALLIACTNVANLLLARSAERRRELGMRMVLGAGRRRLVRQLLTESLLLSLLGGIGALLFARWTLGIVGSLQIPGRIRLADLPTQIDLYALGFTMALAFVCSLLFGTLPALSGTRPDPLGLIRDGNEAGARLRLPATLVTVQTALTLSLLFGGGLFVRSLGTALDVDLGFQPEAVTVASVDLGVAGYETDAALAFYREAASGLAALPEVERAAWAMFVPVQSGMRMETFGVVGRERDPGDPTDVALNYVSAEFFETLDIRLVQGRPIRDEDRRDAPPVTVVNETLASHFWPSGDAVGSRLVMPGPEGPVEMEIVGVAADTKTRGLREEPMPYAYLPIDQWGWLIATDRMRLAARTTVPPEDAVEAIRLRLADTDAALPVTQIRTLEDQIYDLVMPQRVGATLLGLFAVLTLIIAAVGVYGVVAAAVAGRVREIGIRRALGARGADVATLVMTKGLVPVLAGFPLGWLLALAMARMLAGFLPGLSPADPATLIATSIVLAVAAVIACCVPAMRATRFDPVASLRSD